MPSLTYLEDIKPEEAFAAVSSAIDKDRELGTFAKRGTESVSWLARDPRNAEELAINIYERFRSLGITTHMDGSPREALVMLGKELDAEGKSLGSASKVGSRLCSALLREHPEITMIADKREISMSDHMKALEVRTRLNAKNASMQR